MVAAEAGGNGCRVARTGASEWKGAVGAPVKIHDEVSRLTAKSPAAPRRAGWYRLLENLRGKYPSGPACGKSPHRRPLPSSLSLSVARGSRAAAGNALRRVPRSSADLCQCSAEPFCVEKQRCSGEQLAQVTTGRLVC
ncbi:hypothetical protein GN956_G919 [Arapaima gigas]